MTEPQQNSSKLMKLQFKLNQFLISKHPNYSDPGGTLEKIKQPKTLQFGRERANHSDQRVNNNGRKSLRVSRPLSMKQAAKSIQLTFAQLERRTPQSIIYPPEKISLEQAAFGTR